jgi:hypothetical protein
LIVPVAAILLSEKMTMKLPRWSLYWELINGPVAALGLVIVHEELEPYATLLAVLLWGFALVLYYKQRQVSRARHRLKEAEKNFEDSRTHRDHYGMLRQTLVRISQIIKGRAKLQRELVLALQDVSNRDASPQYMEKVHTVLATEQFSEIVEQEAAYQGILDAIREQLTSDSFGRHPSVNNFFPHDFFKVTFYRREKRDSGVQMLHRFMYSSPPGWNPNPASEWLPADHRAGTMWLAWTTRRIQIIEDITQPAQREAKQWRDFRAKQHDNYTALACIPVLDIFAEDGVAGVITIDTNRQLYFRDTPDYKAFLGELLEPYMDYLVLLKYVSLTYKKWQTVFRVSEENPQLVLTDGSDGPPKSS